MTTQLQLIIIIIIIIIIYFIKNPKYKISRWYVVEIALFTKDRPKDMTRFVSTLSVSKIIDGGSFKKERWTVMKHLKLESVN